jgi:predicted DsbA family dithiol-disulfide isomerase
VSQAFERVDLEALGLAGASGAIGSGEAGAINPGIELYLDPVCPYSYLAFTALQRLADRESLEPSYHPLPLAGAEAGLSAAETRMHAQHQEARWPTLRSLARSSFGLALTPVDWGATGHAALALILWQVKNDPSRLAPCWKRLFEARFRDGKDIDRIEVILEICKGGPADEIQAAIEDPAFEDRVFALRRDARKRSVTLVPTTIFGGGHVIVGAQPEAVLLEALAQVRLAAALDGADLEPGC